MNIGVSFHARLIVGFLLIAAAAPAATADPLPSWREGPAKESIVGFVTAVMTPGKDYVRPQERIAVFDNDGTLWCEQPIYFQFAFALDRIRALAPRHPEWKTERPFAAVLSGDTKALAASGEKGIAELLGITHAGMTVDQFADTVREWLKTARHPRFDRPYTDLVYQPMLEVLAYLRANDFKTFIVSGGGVEFMRGFAEETYGIPPEQVVGSSGKTEFRAGSTDGKPVIVKDPAVEFVDDGPGKPVGINHFIGRRPIFAFGNSDGDRQMLEWTAAGEGLRFAGIVHHTDAEREYAYDRDSPVGKLDKALDEAEQRGWTVVDMKRGWRTVFAFQEN
jgi:phosphoglycolate phosphatase-like HAD superfamily hydrolase